jgi:hypothetical protein
MITLFLGFLVMIALWLVFAGLLRVVFGRR